MRMSKREFYHNIYSGKASLYQSMIAAEDYENHLLTAIQSFVNLTGARVVDFGSGTGRIPLLLAPFTRHVVALDLYRAMLLESRLVQTRQKLDPLLVQADNRAVPLDPNTADLVTAGWSIGHMRGWYPDDWRAQISRVLDEMFRVACPGATVIIFETLSTGALLPVPPTPQLAEYYHWLETTWGFSCNILSTDYQFKSAEDAVHQMEFFFGAQLASDIRSHQWSIVPEWTGMWVKMKA